MAKFDDFDLDIIEKKVRRDIIPASIISQHSFCTPNCLTGFLCPPKTQLTCTCKLKGQ